MNTIKSSTVKMTSAQLLKLACERIAPVWPLDQMIAVNPLWEMRSENYHQVAAQLAMLANVDNFMPMAYYQKLYDSGIITTEALERAAQQHKVGLSGELLMTYLSTPSEQPNHFHSLAELFDRERSSDKMSWQEEVTHQISQFCAIHFQQQGSEVEQTKTTKTNNLYQHWLAVTQRDRGLSILMREPGLNQCFEALPTQADELLKLVIEELSLDDDFLIAYSHGLLLEINGWASWVAYLRFQARLNNEDDSTMQSLLAIKMAWELVIWRHHQQNNPMRLLSVKQQWLAQQSEFDAKINQHQEQQIPYWIWQSALEFSYQHNLNQKLLNHVQSNEVMNSKLQAAFCIDVRSEVFRRSLEQQDEGIQTLGFAGFFGLPICFQPAHTTMSRPQLPGLLKPIIKVEQRQVTASQAVSTRIQARWKNWSQSAPASFSMVEATGWWYAFKLLKQSLASKALKHPVNELSHQAQWRLSENDIELGVEAKADLAKNILEAMGLVDFAPWVLLIGHGSQSTNNLQAAGLDCGACGGQTGEVNVRVLAELLNDRLVRITLLEQGIIIPATTRFVAALHNTTTDEITCFDEQTDEQIVTWLREATSQTQQERMVKIDATWANKTAQQRHCAFIKRANDWSQVRPEWGLANNAGFIMAPRSWTRALDLEGRCFLHDYAWQNDEGFSVLELLITAPMVVTHWINMQYNLSVTENRKFGSGNKVLHNAVNGNMGVFEGNGGDLRIGLAKQSLHDGQQWMHSPQRLSVYIAAPEHAILNILNKHKDIESLVKNHWLYLFTWHEKQIKPVVV